MTSWSRDTDEKTIVVNGDAAADGSDVTGSDHYYVATYKVGDQFRIAGATKTMDEFEKALSLMVEGDDEADPQVVAIPADTINITIYDDDDDINVFEILVNNNPDA